MAKKKNPKYFEFSHKRLKKRAREYRDELNFITVSLSDINARIQRCSNNCKFTLELFKKEKRHLRNSLEEDFSCFADLMYHLENFTFRLHAYRDKFCIFIDKTMCLDYGEDDTQIYNRLLKSSKVKKFNIDTELKKFKNGTTGDFLRKRKLMSHRIYFSDKNNYSNILPRNDATTSEWRKGIVKEANSANKAFLRILEINENTVVKLEKYLNSIK